MSRELLHKRVKTELSNGSQKIRPPDADEGSDPPV